MATREFRTLGTLRSAGNRRVSGVAVRYGSPSRELYEMGQRFTEVIERGALTADPAGDVLLLYGHDVNRLLARTSSGTLQLDDRDDGLHFFAELPDTADGRDTYELIQRGDLSGCSFAFRCDADRWDSKAKPPVRTVERAMISEISLVSQPAYTSTSVHARSAIDEPAAMVRLRLRAAARRERYIAIQRLKR